MTTTTETTKHALFTCLERLKRQVKPKSVGAVTVAELEECLEEYLEDLRKDSAALIAIAGDETRALQATARQYLLDVQSAEKYSDLFSEQLADAKCVIADQEKRIEGQHTVIGRLYMEKYSGTNCGNPGHANFCRCTV